MSQGQRGVVESGGIPGNGAISSTYSKSCSQQQQQQRHTTQSNNLPRLKQSNFPPAHASPRLLHGIFPAVGDKFSLHRQENSARGIGKFIAILWQKEIYFPLHCRHFSVVSFTEQAGVKLGGVWDGVKCHTEVKTSLNLNRHRPPRANNKNIFSL